MENTRDNQPVENSAGRAAVPPAPQPSDAPGDAALLWQQLLQAQEEIRRLKTAAASQDEPPAEPAPEALTPQQAMEKLAADPVGFIRGLIDTSAEKHLAAMKEEAELRGALNAVRRKHPEFQRFESFIMKEVAALIENDPDGGIDPWDRLLEKGLEAFRQKFKDTLEAEAARLVKASADAPVPHMEGAANRTLPEPEPSFTREQIARMSLDEFLQKEAAINRAMQKNRIR